MRQPNEKGAGAGTASPFAQSQNEQTNSVIRPLRCKAVRVDSVGAVGQCSFCNCPPCIAAVGELLRRIGRRQ